jgi:UDP-2,4-diacetamido-2,4,6-trideoxy-beta-L-altropyranose hydrolase
MTRVLFRVDASLQIGSGHVQRCLTLADALRQQGWECHFLSRLHPGNMLSTLAQQGFTTWSLPCSGMEATAVRDQSINAPQHAAWLGASQEEDARQTVSIVEQIRPDWLVVDHYALDATWEQQLQALVPRVLVIDDLADRQHSCHVLLDQNLGRKAQQYAGKVPVEAIVLAGPRYALLRPEFRSLRERSLARRPNNKLSSVFISMGGVDQSNTTGRILTTLRQCPLDVDTRITIVMGSRAPELMSIQEASRQLPWPTDVKVDAANMAELMTAADLAIGAAGGSAWERCCLGLPSLLVVLAENQRPGALALGHAGAARLIGDACDINTHLPSAIDAMQNAGVLAEMAANASSVTDGQGVERVVTAMETCHA